ncbi:MAG: ASKHA domain-containing protein [Planctomycetota bacterium]|jgi:uncharacterized 2Fe-2S/4Fe-4S cluster protein (DUF4445 family)|nr:ASKHA domain-containing protein [Planctomycetota bacterium]MDP7129971.1 ASKHA domain-containing protein [Planctomycetota bacterium]MDP7252477.1 ASKHA domain-containing protein [Planctomycetota bacterium]
MSITFQPSGIRTTAETGTTLLQAAIDAGEGIESLCGGHGYCGKCKVQVVSESDDDLLPPSELDEKYLSADELQRGIRLSCRAKFDGRDAIVLVPESSRRGRHVIHKGARELPVSIEPNVEWYHLQVPLPTLEQPVDDVTRIEGALEEIYGVSDLSWHPSVLRELHQNIRKKKGDVSVLVRELSEIMDVRPGLHEQKIGLAVDVGTTTIAAYLTDLSTGQILCTESMMNPQASHGEDLMSRLGLVRQKLENLTMLQQLVVNGLNSLLDQFSGSTGIKSEEVLDTVIVGNTAMHHIIAGLDPRGLATVPFPPVVTRSLDLPAAELGIHVHPNSKIHFLPIEAGFVGADNVAVLVAEQPHLSEEVVLIIDIGTNGEIVLGNKERLLCTSCASGPAFEGAHIKHGMRAMPGAVEKIRIDNMSPEYKVVGHEDWFSPQHPCPEKIRGICGSGIVDAMAQMLDCGIIDSSGRMTTEEKTGIIEVDSDLEYIIVPGDQTTHGDPITVTARDVRALQNSKGAIQGGIRILFNRYGIDRPDSIVLAGAFGMHLNIESVLRIGMLPAIPREKMFSIGNAAGDGARLALLSTQKRQEAGDVARQTEYVELSSDPNFNDEFVMGMMFPDG